jgi:hypothetical protein
MNFPPIQIIVHELSNIEWFGRFRDTFNAATETGPVCGALQAIAAWQRWLLVNQPQESRRAAIPIPRLLDDILDRDGKPS